MTIDKPVLAVALIIGTLINFSLSIMTPPNVPEAKLKTKLATNFISRNYRMKKK